MSIFEQSILNDKAVPHPDVFWYRFSSMCAQKVHRKVSPTFMPYIFFVKTKLNGLQIPQKQNLPSQDRILSQDRRATSVTKQYKH